MLAAIDSGNSSLKIGIFSEGKLLTILNPQNTGDIRDMIRQFPVHKIVISDVAGRKESILTAIPGGIPRLVVSHELRLPFTIRYRTPETLGADRIAAVAGARDEFRNTDILIVDAGTCITYDLLEENGDYLGGGISPGIGLRLKALHDFTANLPDIEVNEHYELIGTDTAGSMRSGTIGGIVRELDGMIEQYRFRYPGLKVLMTGGAAGFFENELKGPIFVVPGLVLNGLRVIAECNEV
jgi:type III pantothenate kinase